MISGPCGEGACHQQCGEVLARTVPAHAGASRAKPPPVHGEWRTTRWAIHDDTQLLETLHQVGDGAPLHVRVTFESYGSGHQCGQGREEAHGRPAVAHVDGVLWRVKVRGPTVDPHRGVVEVFLVDTQGVQTPTHVPGVVAVQHTR